MLIFNHPCEAVFHQDLTTAPSPQDPQQSRSLPRCLHRTKRSENANQASVQSTRPTAPPAAPPRAVKGSEQLILDKANRARLAGPVQTPIPYVPKGFPFLSLVAVGPIPGAVSEHPSEPFTEAERSQDQGCLPSSSLSRPGASSAATGQKFIHPGSRY